MNDSDPNERDAKECSQDAVSRFVRALELNAWLAVATATYVAALYLVRHHPEWSPTLKTTATLLPVLPGLLYLRKGMQMLRSMDELQRRIQVEGWLFAALGTVVVDTVVNVFNEQGLSGTWPAHGMGVGATYLTMFILWSVGVMIANLRYR